MRLKHPPASLEDGIQLGNEQIRPRDVQHNNKMLVEATLAQLARVDLRYANADQVHSWLYSPTAPSALASLACTVLAITWIAQQAIDW